ncbi:MAG: hypothetical protein WA960_16295 [Tunicatimonas sp.]
MKIPHVFVFLFLIIVACSALSYVIPSGAFEREGRLVGGTEQRVVIPGTYQPISKHYSIKGLLLDEEVGGRASPTSLQDILTSVPKGLNQSATLIFFVFITGAVLNLIIETKAIHAFLVKTKARFAKSPTALFFILYLTLSVLSSFFGIGIGLIPLVPVVLLLAKQYGYNRMFGSGLILLPLWIGWATATTNPFTVHIAQQLAELPIGSGLALRFVVFVLGVGIGYWYLMRYGKSNKDNENLTARKNDVTSELDDFDSVIMTRRHVGILVTFVLGYVAIFSLGWSFVEMGGGLIGLIIVITFVGGLTTEKSMLYVVRGLEVMIVPALVIGVARGVSVVMQESLITDTMLFHASNSLSGLPKSIAAVGMLLFQSLLNFFIPSASGQALVSMPLMTPLADLLGISRQTAVLAFVFGDGFTNLIIPTNGVLMAMLGIAGVPFDKWFRFALPVFSFLLLLSIVAVLFAVWTEY